jgi:hypothetical protein
VDEVSLGLITGSKVDYATELIGSQFKIVDNPAASSNCGYALPGLGLSVGVGRVLIWILVSRGRGQAHRHGSHESVK